MHHEHIPDELKALPQWCCASDGRFGKAGMPLDPNTGMAAKANDSSTWGTFEQAYEAAQHHNLPIGIMLTADDPYTIIDLDNKVDNPATPEEMQRYLRMIEVYDSYTELSNSGRGYHIIVRGAIGQGRRREKVEVYSQERFMITTGNSYHRDEPKPIADRQELLDMLVSQMEAASRSVELEYHDEPFTDATLVEIAGNAANGDKFTRLCNGLWQDEVDEGGARQYESQSDADYALLAMLAYYTPSNEQVCRVFRMSQLGKREKAQRDAYLLHSLSRIRARHIEMGHTHRQIDMEAVNRAALAAVEQVAPAVAPTPAPAPVPLSTDGSLPLPPGLIGEVAQYIYATSQRPVPEISLCAAMGLVAGMVGRNFNFSDTGLNQYIALVAETGHGKEEANKGINRLLASVRASVPPVDQFIGPAAFASGPALVRSLDDHPVFLSVLGEFGMLLNQLADKRAPSAVVALQRALLDLYGKSGWGQVLRSSAYADREKNTKTVHSPALTILGESTPEQFYGALNEDQIASGLLPRFLVVEYKGHRPPRNPNAGAPPSPMLADKFANLAATILHMQQNNSCQTVGMDQGAQVMLDAFDREADEHINATHDGVTRQLWNRAHLKALKLAGLIAVGVNHHNPMVSTVEASWAIDMVRRDVATISARFAEGRVGDKDATEGEDAIRSVIMGYLQADFDKRVKGKAPKSVAAVPGVIPFTYLWLKLRGRAVFKNDRRGAEAAVKATLKVMVETATLQQVPPMQVQSEYGTGVACYYVGEAW